MGFLSKIISKIPAPKPVVNRTVAPSNSASFTNHMATVLAKIDKTKIAKIDSNLNKIMALPAVKSLVTVGKALATQAPAYLNNPSIPPPVYSPPPIQAPKTVAPIMAMPLINNQLKTESAMEQMTAKATELFNNLKANPMLLVGVLVGLYFVCTKFIFNKKGKKLF